MKRKAKPTKCFLMEGLQSYINKEMEQAIVYFDRSILCESETTMATLYRAFAHYHLGNYGASIDDLSTVIHSAPHPVMYGYRAQVNLKMNAYNEAYADFRLAIKNNGEIIKIDDKSSLLFDSITNRNDQVLDILLSLGINVNEKDEEGNTPLMLACEMGCFQLVKKLIDKGASIDCTNQSNTTAIMLAIKNNHLNIAQWLKNKTIKNFDSNDTVPYPLFFFENIKHIEIAQWMN